MINKANYIAIFEHPRLGERMRVSTFLPQTHPATASERGRPMPRRHRLSTHLIRRTARSAQRHYEYLQYEATLDGEAGEYARKALADLGIGLTQKIEVERATIERAKWRVMAE